MKFKKITDDGNAYGFDMIEVLEFNYDGEGHAIIKEDGELAFCHKNDLNLIMFGDPGSGEKWYELSQ